MSNQIDYRERIRRVTLYIEDNLSEPIRLRDMAKIACFSEFHFHRVFLACMGVTLYEYTNYRRLFKAADLILNSSLRITDIAMEVGFESSAAFATAFKKHFRVTPSKFGRTRGKGFRIEPLKFLDSIGVYGSEQRKLKADRIPYETRTLPELKLLSLSKRGYFSGCFFKAAQDGYTELHDYLDTHGLLLEAVHRISIYPELPYSMNDPDAVINCGFSVNKEVQSEQPFELLTIPAGKYAVFHYAGPYEYIYQTWIIAYLRCFLIGNEQVRDVAPFELYLNSPRDTSPEDLMTEVHIPIL
jgi:AraC family transcriptional regulator